MKKQELRIVVLGLSLSSSWGNGHATTYRALLRSLSERGHQVLFLERDVPWYAAHRDLVDPGNCLRYYEDLADLESHEKDVRKADAVIIGSYVPEGIAVADWVFRTARGTVVFYDIDTPVTLSELARGTCTYLSPAQVRRYDLYLSFTGGPTLNVLKTRWGAAAPRALYCSVDPDLYKPTPTKKRWHLGYLGTYSRDRQPAVERFVIEPARRAPSLKFVVAGAQYPSTIAWPANAEWIEHIPPSRHAKFYSSLRWALNLTRADMRKAGYSPSVRLFEAGACGTPMISDDWPGLETFFVPGRDIIVANSVEDFLTTLELPKSLRDRIGQNGRERVLRLHTSERRAAELEDMLMSRRAKPKEPDLNRMGGKQYERLNVS